MPLAQMILFVIPLSVLSLKEVGTLVICVACDLSEEFLVKIPTVGPGTWIKSDQIYPHLA